MSSPANRHKPEQASSSAHLDRSVQLGFLIAEPHHPDDRKGDAEPVEEAEEVDDGEDVVGEGVEQRHQALQRARETNQARMFTRMLSWAESL